MVGHDPSDIEATLTRLRGRLPIKSSHARDVAADLDHPGCRLRTILDAAAVDKAALAERLGAPMPEEQSPAALRRGQLFERRVIREGFLLKELEQQLGVPLPQLTLVDLSSTGGRRGRKAVEYRAARTRDALQQLLTDPSCADNVLHHPVTTLDRGGRPCYLEQDALAFVVGGQLHVVEIKSFSVIPGVPTERSAVQQAARQSAVYVLSLQQMLAELGLGADLVSTTTILITTKGFGLTPMSHTLDVRNELKALRRRLARRGQLANVLDEMPSGLTFDVADPIELAKQVAAVEHNYVPGCLSSCSMARACRQRCIQRGAVDRLGSVVRSDLGDLRTIDDVVHAAQSGRADDPHGAEVAEALHAAHQAYLAAGGAA